METLEMESIELVRSWKDPKSRREDAPAGEHPAGEIALWSPGGLSRRADLLTDSALQVNAWTIETMSIISVGFDEE